MTPTLVDILVRHAEEQPGRPAYITLDQSEQETGRRTFAELDARSRRLAAWLVSERLSGKTILLLLNDAFAFVESFTGCLYAGSIAVPVSIPRPNKPLTILRAIARDADVACVIAGRTEASYLRAPIAEEVPNAVWLYSDDIDHFDAGGPSVRVRPDDLAFLQYTSGSTGSPKGVMVTHGNLVQNEAAIQHGVRLSRESCAVNWLPLYHDMGLIGNVLQPLYTGFTTVLMPPVAFIQRPGRWLRAIARYRGTLCGGPNFAYDLCVDKTTEEERAGLDLSSWEVAYNGSEPVRARTVQRFIEAFAPARFRATSFYPCYGMAESTLYVTGHVFGTRPTILQVDPEALALGTVQIAASPSAAAGDTPPHDTSGRNSIAVVSCGFPVLGTRVLIVDPDTRTPLPEGTVGEIWVNGGSVCAGYYRKPGATNETFHARVAGGGSERFLRTGDLGFLHDGHLYITGRLKDLIIIRGRNHYPQDLEATAQQSHPFLQRDGGIAVALDDRGQAAIAIAHELTREGWHAADPKLVTAAVREAVAAEHGVQVGRVLLLKPGRLPRTTSGKLRRAACRAMIEAGEFDVRETLTPTTTEGTL